MRNKKILITGGEGLLVAIYASLIGAMSLLFDNRLMNREPYQIDGVEYFYGCASDVDSHFSGLNIIYHLGEYSRVEQSLTEPLQCVKNISHSFTSILEFARKNQQSLFIQVPVPSLQRV